MIRAGSCYSSSIAMNKRSRLIEAVLITRSGETLFPLFSSPSEPEQSIAPSMWIRSSGVQEFRSSGGQEFRSSGVQEFRSSGVQEFRSSGVQEFRSSGVQEFRVGRAPKLQEKPAF